jgi:hypothetical protein
VGHLHRVLPAGISPRGSWGGTPLVNGAAAIGASSVAIDGLTPSVAGTGKRGDWIKFNGHSKVYQLTADADANGSGQATLSLMPALNAAVADNEPVTFSSSVPFTLILAGDEQRARAAAADAGHARLRRDRGLLMNRGASAAVQAEWAKAQNAPAIWSSCSSTSPTAARYTSPTATARSVYGGNSYIALGALLEFAGVTESVELRIADAQLTLQGVARPTSRPSCSGSTCTGACSSTRCSTARPTRWWSTPWPIHDGRMDEPQITEDPDSGKCVVSLRSRDQFADFERLTGRHTNPNDQALWFPNDRAFDLIAQLAAQQQRFTWGRSLPAGALGAFPGHVRPGRRRLRHGHLMRFQAEAFERWHREAAPMFRAHWELVGRHKDLVPLEVDVERWVASERAGLIAAFTARTQWRLDGYALYLTAPSLNYKGRVFAYCHAIYIEPRELAGLKAIRFARFIDFCDAELKRARLREIDHAHEARP